MVLTRYTCEDMNPISHHLSKSRFVAGTQCHKLLWWKVHEPNAVELQPDKVLQDRFDQGNQVTALARDRFPGWDVDRPALLRPTSASPSLRN